MRMLLPDTTSPSCPVKWVIFSETESRRNQILEVVAYIEERLKELDEEKEELQKYQKLDKERRTLEYTIFDKELADAEDKLKQVGA